MAIVDLPADSEAWPLRLDGEPPRAFAAFRVYRDLGVERSLRQAAIAFYGLDVDTVSPAKMSTKTRQVAEWSRLWRWVDRARESDRLIDLRAQATAARELVEMRERHAATGKALMNRGAAALLATDPGTISPGVARGLVVAGAALERAARSDDAVRVELGGAVDVGVESLREMLTTAKEHGAAVWGDVDA